MTRKQLAEVLRLHGLWLSAAEGGVRADLSYENLSYADLSYADLSGANLRGANLRGARLSGADLSDASLSGANLRGVIGNMREIRSIHIDTWPVAWVMSPEGVATVQIGCQRHTLAEWAEFSDKKIISMHSRALDWWRANRDFVLSTVERYPAVPYGSATHTQERRDE
jgi:uncharacterized protein YjbI with pentapeptide repeats